MILDMLTNGEFDLARDAKLEEIDKKVNGRNSWDSPQYHTDKEIQQSIKLDHSRNLKLTYAGVCQLVNRYFLKDANGTPVETPQTFFARVATGVCRGDAAFAQRLYDRLSSLHFMLATPVICNAGTSRGQQISCFLNRCEDSIEGIFDDMLSENAQISKGGGGIGTYMGDVRGKDAKISIGGKSEGIIPFVKMIDSLVPAIKQAGMRKGAAAVYINVDHPDIEDFIKVRDPTGGDENRRCMNLNNAVVVTDTFMEAVRDGRDYDLICPNTKKSVRKLSARYVWEELIRMRSKTGEPYILFYDTINKNIPQHHKEMGLEVVQSNLCAEITLPTNYDRTAVCCLGSVNLETFDEWHDELDEVTEDICRALDNVLDNFIENAPDRYRKAKFSASMERSIGVGMMGYQGYLMGKGWPFASYISRCFNKNVTLKIKQGLIRASEKLAIERGPCPDGGNRRNSNLMAIAPTATISTIAGSATPCIEPLFANSYPIETMDGTFMMRNKYLTPVLDKHGQNTPKVWRSISNKKGSVQHLDFLSDDEKEVFKIGDELDQREIIVQAAHRQKAMDYGTGGQSQSVNLFYKTPMKMQELHEAHFMAWELGLKSLYYLRSTAASEADTADKIKARSGKMAAVEEEEEPKVCMLNPGGNPNECSVCQ